MEEASSNLISKRIAAVTGANKGIGLEICRQLCSTGTVLVVLTARDAERGLAAVEKLRAAGASDVLFHQLDVTDSISISDLADFIRIQFGKLDILVNNAGIIGFQLGEKLSEPVAARGMIGDYYALVETFDMTEKCINTNYYGTKRVTEALIPLLQLSESPRIVNLTSVFGKLQYIPGKSIKEKLRDVDALNEDQLDELVQSSLNDYKSGKLEENGWPTKRFPYIVSKVSIATYTRLLARKYPEFCINCVHPGFIKTDMTWNHGVQPVEEGAQGAVMLALLPDGAPSGLFYDSTEIGTYE